MTVYLDFDGTVVEHNYPALGEENPQAFRIIRALQDRGHSVILNTYRSDINDGSLEEALGFLNNPQKGIIPILQHTSKKIHPGPFDMVESLRFDRLFIDDIAEGIPLIPNLKLVAGFMVDWPEVEKALKAHGILG